MRVRSRPVGMGQEGVRMGMDFAASVIVRLVTRYRRAGLPSPRGGEGEG